MIRVVTAPESAARDASAIAAGIPSRALMERAGAAAAGEIAIRLRDRLADGVLVIAGPGNNGGDAWVVARALAASGVRVRVVEPVPAKTDDARAERSLALSSVNASSEIDQGEGVIVDGLLGTGARRASSDAFAPLVKQLKGMRARGAVVVALDVPSGLDATSGERIAELVDAHLTVTFGTIKRGQLVDRDACGNIVAVDIGLGGHADLDDGAPRLVDDRWAASNLPRVRASSHKGERKKVAIVGGHEGMAGAAILAARGAFRTGVGMVKLVVAQPSISIVQESEPHALAAAWPADDAAVERDIAHWADAVIIGPGLGRGEDSRTVLERVLRVWRGPVLLDADALTLFENRADQLAALLAGRRALITPHVVEFGRLANMKADDVLAERFDVAQPLAKHLGAVVLLKGVPTVITSPAGECLVSATGTPALGTGGSGDVLSGIAGTLLAQTDDPFIAGALGAYAHGRAAERVPVVSGSRGISLEDVVNELRNVWDFDASPLRYPVLAELPAIAS